MTCQACADAKIRYTGKRNVECCGCKARWIARSTHFTRVRSTGALDWQYRALLEKLNVKHEDVKAAAAIDAAHKAKTA